MYLRLPPHLMPINRLSIAVSISGVGALEGGLVMVGCCVCVCTVQLGFQHGVSLREAGARQVP